MDVTAETLLRGAWYAAEQCGHMLRNAAILHRQKAYSTAAAIALLGREELGGHNFLLDHWKKAVRTGTGPDADALRDGLHDHLLKQQRSNLTITYMNSGEGGFAAISRRIFAAAPGSEEYWKASDELTSVLQRKAKRAPDERHSTRMRALYVDLDASGTDWNRPAAISPSEATNCLLHAVNDYARVHDNLRHELLMHSNRDLAMALAAWTDKPPLPLPDFDFELFPQPSAEIGGVAHKN